MNQSVFCCPVCGETLYREDKRLFCHQNHSYDRAKSGYVNLLMAQKKQQHGDDKTMVQARTRFLEGNYYLPLCDAVCETAKTVFPSSGQILDAGCGEGWYTERVFRFLTEQEYFPQICGIDLSKDALSTAARRCRKGEFAAASIFHLPILSDSVDLILNIFAPDSSAEFFRVLKPGGSLIRVVPRADHLMELKQIVYENVYENPEKIPIPDGFQLISDQTVRYPVFLHHSEAISDLFTMTPYYYKTSPSDRAKLQKVSTLQTTAAFGVLLYRKNSFGEE